MSRDPEAPTATTPPRLTRRGLLRLGAAGPLIGVAGASYLRLADDGAPIAAAEGTPPASPAAGCAASPQAIVDASPAGSPAAAVTVRMTTDLRFEPQEVTIKVGEAVAWVNDSPIPHTATGDPAQNPVDTTRPELVQLPDGAEPWGSELLQPGQTYAHTFVVPGRYAYICVPHVLSGMQGTITVEC